MGEKLKKFFANIHGFYTPTRIKFGLMVGGDFLHKI